jgi:AraC family transcriptional regulator
MTDRTAVLGAGSIYGIVQGKREQCEAIFSDVHQASPRKQTMNAHELPYFELILSGQYGESNVHQEAQVRPFTMIFRPAGVPHEDEIGPRGVTLFEIELRPSWRKRLEDGSGHLDRAAEDCNGGELLWLGLKLYRRLHAGTADGLEIESLLSELLGRVARMPGEQARRRPAWLKRVVDRLTAEYAGKMTLDELGHEAGVHPVHLSRVFRKWTGESVGEYVHRLRIRAACEQMLVPEIPIAEIGLATGFADQSHFTKHFKRIVGVTPGLYSESHK